MCILNYVYELKHGQDAAEELRRNRDQFTRNVRQTLVGAIIRGQQYDKVMEE